MKNLKVITLTTLSFILITFITLISCNKTTQTQDKSAKPQASKIAFLEGQSTTKSVKCNGSCNTCNLQGIIGPNGEQGLSCGCQTNCALEISTTTNDVVTVSNDPDGYYDVKFLDAFENYIDEQYSSTEYLINSVEIYTYANSDFYAIMYDYDVSGENSTILFIYNPDASSSNEVTVRYDCSATLCNCHEIYSIPTGNVSCSCGQDCTLTITNPIFTSSFVTE